MARPRPPSRLLRLLLILFLLPYALVPLYLVLPPVSTLMLDDMLSLQMPKRKYVRLENISVNLKAAVLAGEDSAFCEHFGFDFNQIEKSMDRAMDGKKLRGASTITQQTAKNLFLWNGRSWLRKALEAPITLWMELILPKRRILELYLNVAEWGPGIYGAEAASRYYFNKPASRLHIHEAAQLAAALPNPARFASGRPSPGQSISAAVIASRVMKNAADMGCLR